MIRTCTIYPPVVAQGAFVESLNLSVCTHWPVYSLWKFVQWSGQSQIARLLATELCIPLSHSYVAKNYQEAPRNYIANNRGV